MMMMMVIMNIEGWWCWQDRRSGEHEGQRRWRRYDQMQWDHVMAFDKDRRFLPTDARHKSVTRSLQTWAWLFPWDVWKVQARERLGESPGCRELLSPAMSLNSAKHFVCWKISGAVSSELTVELLRNRLPQELLLIAKQHRSSSDARTGCPATGDLEPGGGNHLPSWLD